MMHDSLSRIKPALRTKDKPFGNFGRNKVKSGSPLRDLGITDAEVVRLASRSSYIKKMLDLYDKAPSESMRRFAVNELHRLGCFRERRLEPEQPEPYRPMGT